MTKHKTGKLNVVLLLVVALVIATSGASGQKVVKGVRAISTDTEYESEIAALMKQTSGQKRPSLTFNAILARVARERAYDMATRNYFDHVNPDGVGPNYLVTKAGYLLPDSYSKGKSSNSIESISCGNKTAQAAWDEWMGSSPHRKHLLGLSKDYAEQIEYGVGHAYVPQSQYRHYWVVIAAKPGVSKSPSKPSKKTSASASDGAGSASSYLQVAQRWTGLFGNFQETANEPRPTAAWRFFRPHHQFSMLE